MSKNTSIMLAAAAAALFAAGTVATVSTPVQAAVKCVGANACKGQSECKTASSSCKGLNSCKGLGYIETPDAAACTKAGGKAA